MRKLTEDQKVFLFMLGTAIVTTIACVCFFYVTN
jgi:hypothetical protein